MPPRASPRSQRLIAPARPRLTRTTPPSCLAAGTLWPPPRARSRAPGTVAGEIPDDAEHRHLRTAIAFTNTVRSSQACSENAYFADEGLEGRLWEAIANDVRAANAGRSFLGLDVDHVDGTTRAVARSEALSALERQSRDTTGPTAVPGRQ